MGFRGDQAAFLICEYPGYPEYVRLSRVGEIMGDDIKVP
jgi:hypothetical protein